eukprot:gene2734-5382_t
MLHLFGKNLWQKNLTALVIIVVVQFFSNFYNFSPNPTKNLMIFPFLVVAIAILIFLLLVIDVYILVHFQHPDDKNESYVAKFIIVIGLLVSQLSVLLLPIDVANNNGSIDCQSNADGNVCGGIDMTLFWQVLLVIVIVMLIVIIPFATFFYEADDGSLTGTEKRSKFCIALKYEFCILVVASATLLSAYFTSSDTSIPVNVHSLSIDQLDVYTISASPGASPYSFIDQSYIPNFNLQTSTTKIVFHVNFPIYIIALMSWIGWWFFAFFAGFGLAAVPFDFIKAFVTRPRVLAPDEIANYTLTMQERTQALIEISAMVKKERLEFKRTATSSSDRRLRWAKDRVEVNRLGQMVFMLQEDIERLNACKTASHEYNSLIPYVQLLFGIIFMVISILWEVHIILFMLISPPVSAFLSWFFSWFDTWFPMFGTITYAFFSLYMFFCAIKGSFKLGVRCMCVKIHPMKISGTYVNSFLFNLGIIMLCTIPLVQFCATAFASYVRYSDIYHIFGIQIKYLRFFVLFNTNEVFIWILFLMAPLSVLYLSLQPVDRAASAEEFREALQRREASGI